MRVDARDAWRRFFRDALELRQRVVEDELGALIPNDAIWECPSIESLAQVAYQHRLNVQR